jgi:lysophospholipase L1-like esterase
VTAEDSPPPPTAAGSRIWRWRWRRSGSGTIRRELRSLPTLLLVVFCLLFGIPTAILLTPSQDVTAAGQHLSVGARTPSLSISGPAQLIQIGNTDLDITPLQVYGPLRPKLTLGPIQRNAGVGAVLNPSTSQQAQAAAVSSVGDGFVRWYGWATLVLLAFTLAATACTAYLRNLATLRRQAGASERTVAEIWSQSAGQIRGMTVIAVTAVMLAWAVAGGLSYLGAVRGLQNVRSLSDLVGTYHLSPSPVGPKVRGYTGAVLGDSRAARLGGPLVTNATDEDRACARSSDSLADEIGGQLGLNVLNLACSGASIAQGLLGPQDTAGLVVPPQVGRLKQVEGLKFVVVMVGPNDLYWADFLRYCYGVDNCRDNLTQGEFQYRLSAFDKDYGDLLRDLNDLPDRPQVIVVTSYDVFEPDANCRDTRAPGQAGGLSPDNIKLLSNRNAELNDVLTNGAKKYQFVTARPVLTPLCQASSDELGADIQGLSDGHPFHPTGVGMIRIAASVVRVVKPIGGG